MQQGCAAGLPPKESLDKWPGRALGSLNYVQDARTGLRKAATSESRWAVQGTTLAGGGAPSGGRWGEALEIINLDHCRNILAQSEEQRAAGRWVVVRPGRLEHAAFLPPSALQR